MEDTSAEQKVEHVQTHHEQAVPPHEHHEEKKKFNFIRWLKGSNTQEFLENLSYVLIMSSAALLFVGIGLGSFVRYVVFLGAAGALLILVGIILYIVSQLMAPEKGTGEASA